MLVMAAQLDHLVVMAHTLDEGVQWCEATLGITPGPGGEHPLMGTHNRLLSVATPLFPRAYLEIIAINSGATPARPVGLRRWFDMDDPGLQARVAAQGPQLIHFVARTPNMHTAISSLARLRLDRGQVLQASRMTPGGLLSWQITVRADGQRLFYGGLPTLIQWGKVHPADAMPPSGVTLQSLQVSHPRADALRSAQQAMGLTGVTVNGGLPNLIATLQTPRGLVTLESRGI